MKHFVSSIVVGAFALSGLFLSADADACGGCFHIQQSEGGQVTGHRMIFSVSPDKTTLWDQISYDGAPKSFTWMLPIHGQVQVGLSSDALFEQLESMTQVMVFSPDINCGIQTCEDSFNGGAGGGGGGISTTTNTSGGVTVIAQETVGPFETVQLSSEDPAALQDWLAGHGYVIPSDVAPIITAYVNEGFDFLALRLAPGEGVQSMRPVRVTSPGAGLGLPLRMVAAGTGAITPITLWIAGEGRYEAANFPNFTIKSQDVVWNWDTMKSNYTDLKQAGFAGTQNKGWLTESAFATYPSDIGWQIESLAEYDPKNSGYGENSADALAAAQDDLNALYGTINPGNMWLTRVHAQLSKAALGTDLTLGASMNQDYVSSIIYTNQTTGTPPECPPPPDCSGNGGNGSGGNGSGNNGVGLWTPGGDGGDGGGSNENNDSSGGSGGCAMGGEAPAGAAALAVLGLAAALRRRRARRA